MYTRKKKFWENQDYHAFEVRNLNQAYQETLVKPGLPTTCFSIMFIKITQILTILWLLIKYFNWDILLQKSQMIYNSWFSFIYLFVCKILKSLLFMIDSNIIQFVFFIALSRAFLKYLGVSFGIFFVFDKLFKIIIIKCFGFWFRSRYRFDILGDEEDKGKPLSY